MLIPRSAQGGAGPSAAISHPSAWRGHTIDYGFALHWILTVVGPIEPEILTAARQIGHTHVHRLAHGRYRVPAVRAYLCTSGIAIAVHGTVTATMDEPKCRRVKKNGRWRTSAVTSIKNDQWPELWRLPPATVSGPPWRGERLGFNWGCGGAAAKAGRMCGSKKKKLFGPVGRF